MMNSEKIILTLVAIFLITAAGVGPALSDTPDTAWLDRYDGPAGGYDWQASMASHPDRPLVLVRKSILPHQHLARS